MNFERMTLDKSLTTVLAQVRSFTCMQVHVLAKSKPIRTLLSASRTVHRPNQFSCMNFLVKLVLFRVVERLAALVTKTIERFTGCKSIHFFGQLLFPTQ